VRINAIALTVATAATLLACSGCRSTRHPSIGFWYDPGPYDLSADLTARLRGPLTDQERDAIERLSRQEVEHAFAGLSVAVTGDHDAFWRVRVMRSLPTRMNQALPRAGESLALGILGGSGAIGSPDSRRGISAQ
jgi:hypothetical protein